MIFFSENILFFVFNPCKYSLMFCFSFAKFVYIIIGTVIFILGHIRGIEIKLFTYYKDWFNINKYAWTQIKQ